MTFDGAGTCVAYLTEPDSPACGRIRARAYPVQEMGGIVWVYMGDNTPDPVEQAVPHAATVLSQKHLVVSERYSLTTTSIRVTPPPIWRTSACCTATACL